MDRGCLLLEGLLLKSPLAEMPLTNALLPDALLLRRRERVLGEPSDALAGLLGQ